MAASCNSNKSALPVATDVSNVLSSKYERRMVFCFQVNGEHRTERQTDGLGVTHSATTKERTAQQVK